MNTLALINKWMSNGDSIDTIARKLTLLAMELEAQLDMHTNKQAKLN